MAKRRVTRKPKTTEPETPVVEETPVAVEEVKAVETVEEPAVEDTIEPTEEEQILAAATSVEDTESTEDADEEKTDNSTKENTDDAATDEEETDNSEKEDTESTEDTDEEEAVIEIKPTNMELRVAELKDAIKEKVPNNIVVRIKSLYSTAKVVFGTEDAVKELHSLLNLYKEDEDMDLIKLNAYHAEYITRFNIHEASKIIAFHTLMHGYATNKDQFIKTVVIDNLLRDADLMKFKHLFA